MSDFVNITRNNNDIISTYTNNQNDEGGDEGIAGLAAQLASLATLIPVFGATADGVTDDTVKIQNAINACPTWGIVDGAGKTYAVSSLNLKSYMTLRNINLVTIACNVLNTPYSPVTIGATNDTSLKTNIFLFNVNVNGNRHNQSNLSGAENGGRSGFRIIGNVQNILIDNCSATYCATDGIELYSGLGTRTAGEIGQDVPIQKNIWLRNCLFTYNRRHGGSGDSMQYVYFEKCQFNYNGIDVNGGLVEGDKGDTVAGQTYGNGFDLEGYGIGSWFGDIKFEDCIGIQNASSGVLVYDGTSNLQTTSGFVPRDTIRFDNCHFDSGQNQTQSVGQALQLTPAVAGAALNPQFIQNVCIDKCNLNGTLLLRSINHLTAQGGQITSSGATAGTLDNVFDYSIKNINKQGKPFYRSGAAATIGVEDIEGEAILAAGAHIDLGLATNLTIGLLRITVIPYSTYPAGGAFAVDVFLNGGSGATIINLYNGTQVTNVNTAPALWVNGVVAGNWQLQNTNANTYKIFYKLLL